MVYNAGFFLKFGFAINNTRQFLMYGLSPPKMNEKTRKKLENRIKICTKKSERKIGGKNE